MVRKPSNGCAAWTFMVLIFFMYLLVRHLAVTGVLLLLSNTMYGRFAVKCFILWQGVLFGMYAAAACMQYQLRGVLFVSGSLFPHQFVLIPSYVLLIYWCLNEQYIRRRKPWLVLWIFTGIALGCLLESYVSPILIKRYFTILFRRKFFYKM